MVLKMISTCNNWMVAGFLVEFQGKYSNLTFAKSQTMISQKLVLQIVLVNLQVQKLGTTSNLYSFGVDRAFTSVANNLLNTLFCVLGPFWILLRVSTPVPF